MRALSGACIFMACKYAKIEIELALMAYEMMGDMCTFLQMLWVIEHLIAGVEPTAQMPGVRYKTSLQVRSRFDDSVLYRLARPFFDEHSVSSSSILILQHVP